MRAKHTGKKHKDKVSPYKLKTPYTYSGEYRAWRAAVKSQDRDRIEASDADHRKRFAHNPNLAKEIENEQANATA